jgi:hypothetical protein
VDVRVPLAELVDEALRAGRQLGRALGAPLRAEHEGDVDLVPALGESRDQEREPQQRPALDGEENSEPARRFGMLGACRRGVVRGRSRHAPTIAAPRRKLQLAPGMAAPLIHIGYHKTGTKWLRGGLFLNKNAGYHWIDKDTPPVRRLVRAHPLEFDPAESRREFEPLLAEAAKKSLMPVICWGRLAGQAFSGGYDTKEIADRLKAVFPDGRIVVVVREQRSMIVSTYKQYVREGGALPPRKFMLPPRSRSLRVPWFDLRHFEYHHLLAYYRRLFGPNSVLVLPYEQFVTDPSSFVEQIARFAGRPLDDETLRSLPFESATNPSPPATAIVARRWLNGLGVCTDLNPSPPLPSPLFWRLGKHIDRASLAPRQTVEREEAKLRQIVDETVLERYVESNRLTADLIGVDLAAYDWMI